MCNHNHLHSGVEAEHSIHGKCIEIVSAKINNVLVDHLQIPLNKLVVVTGSSGSGKTSLIYDLLAKQSQAMFAEQPSIFAPVSDLTPTRIDGITPIKVLKQDYTFFKSGTTISRFLGLDPYLHTLFANFGQLQIGEEKVRVYKYLDIFQEAQKLPELPAELQQKRSYDARYNYFIEVHFQLLPCAQIYSPEQVAQLSKEEIIAANRNNIELITKHFGANFADYVLVNHKDIVDFQDLRLEDYPHYISSLAKRIETLKANAPVDLQFQAKLQAEIANEEKLFHIMMGQLTLMDSAELAQRFGLKGKTTAKGLSQGIISQLRDKYFPIIYLTNPITGELTKYPLSLIVSGKDEERRSINLHHPTTFNPTYSQYRCKKCNGKGVIQDEDDVHICTSCKGSRFNKEIRNLELFGTTFEQLFKFTITEAYDFFNGVLQEELQSSAGAGIDFSQHNRLTLKVHALDYIVQTLAQVIDTELGYLNLNRSAETLSGGEIQQINIIKILQNKTANMTYILDEPSIGLHARASKKLLQKLRALIANNNSVIVIEHDAEFIRNADHVILLNQGRVEFTGALADFLTTSLPLAQFLRHEKFISKELSYVNNFLFRRQLVKDELTLEQESLKITLADTLQPLDYSLNLQLLQVSIQKRGIPSVAELLNPYSSSFNQDLQQGESQYVVYKGINYNNLKNQTCRIKLQAINVITGVLGSGKTSLAGGVIYEETKALLGAKEPRGRRVSRKILQNCKSIQGLEQTLDKLPFHRVLFAANKVKEFTSNVTLCRFSELDELIGTLFANVFNATYKSLARKSEKDFIVSSANSGRCPTCKGTKFEEIVHNGITEKISCSDCNATGFSLGAQAVYLNNRFVQPHNIAQIYDMTIQEAREFFLKYHKHDSFEIVKKLISYLAHYSRFGLGHLKLSAPVSRLSGGEKQRLHLARELRRVFDPFVVSPEQAYRKKYLIIVDEPTTGLHFSNVQAMLDLFVQLRNEGHTIVIIEHNQDVIFNADHLIEIGPESGIHGGKVVFEGSVAQFYAKIAQTQEQVRKLDSSTQLSDHELYEQTGMTVLMQEMHHYQQERAQALQNLK